MKKICFFFLCLSAHLCFSQDAISKYIKLDTIISSHLKIDTETIGFYDIKGKICGHDLWLFYPNWKDNDSIHFLKINLITKKQMVVNLYFPGLSFKTKSPNITRFDINKEALVILFSNSFAYFTKNKNQYSFSFIEPLIYSYSDIFLLPDKKILIANQYNSHPYSNPDKVILNTYDCVTKKIENTVRPYFNSIAFSHFDPNSWIDVRNDNIILSQTTHYSADFFDADLKKINGYSFTDKNWLFADTNYIEAISHIKPRPSAKELIGMITQLKDTVSRIEAVYFLSETKLLVRKIPAYNKALNRLRMYDVLELNKNNIWEIKQKDLVDVAPKAEDLCTKQAFPLLSVEETVIFSETYCVKLTERFNNFQFGKTFAELKTEEDLSLGKKDPFLFIEIFKINFN